MTVRHVDGAHIGGGAPFAAHRRVRPTRHSWCAGKLLVDAVPVNHPVDAPLEFTEAVEVRLAHDQLAARAQIEGAINFHGDLVDEGERLLPFVIHQAHRRRRDDSLERFQESVGLVQLEMVLEIAENGFPLRFQVDIVDEESGTHVGLEEGTAALVGHGEVLHEQLAVFQEAAATDVFRLRGDDVALAEMVDRVGETRPFRADTDRGIEVLIDVHVGRREFAERLVEEQQAVEHDLERVDREFVLALHAVREFQIDSARSALELAAVAEAEQGPAVAVVGISDFDELLNVGEFLGREQLRRFR